MQMLRYRPGPPLSAFIDQLWYTRASGLQRRRRSALPTGSVDLTFNLLDRASRVFATAADRVGSVFEGAVVHGAHSRYFVLDAHRDTHVVGVHFRPGGGAALLGVAALELADRHFALEDLWGVRARTLCEQLHEAPTPQAKFAVLEREFVARLQSVRPVHPAISFALRGIESLPPPLSIGTLQSCTGYSPRRFTSLFAGSIGLTPKLYSRIARMRRLIDRIAREDEPRWADLAGEYGYYDQAHLIREFREFSGVTPAHYRPLSAQSVFHMELGD